MLLLYLVFVISNAAVFAVSVSSTAAVFLVPFVAVAVIVFDVASDTGLVANVQQSPPTVDSKGAKNFVY